MSGREQGKTCGVFRSLSAESGITEENDDKTCGKPAMWRCPHCSIPLCQEHRRSHVITHEDPKTLLKTKGGRQLG